jgi:predicted NUDIX family NTP pyrophosphohydrolase
LANPISAGLLAYRGAPDGPEFLLVHPGGPFWKNRDAGAWSIPKGLIEPGEDALAAAIREFREEVGLEIGGDCVRLADQRQASGKLILCWMLEADLDLTGFCSNSFELAWPPRSGRTIRVPECDRAAYFPARLALKQLLPGQRGFIREAITRLSDNGRASAESA